MSHTAFIGVGNMGGPMARNLVKAQHRVHVFDLSAIALAAAAEGGAETKSSVRDAVDGADTVITMLPAGAHVRATYLDSGILAAAKRGALLIDCSTIDMESAGSVHEAASRAGFDFLDAPVSGGVAGAEAASLAFMCGGSDKAFARARPVLEKLGTRVVHAGGPGAGQAAKICNNMLLAVSMIGTCEAFVLGEKLGLDPTKLFEIISGASGQCWSVTSYCPVPGPVPAAPSNRNFAGGFATSLMLKDLRLAQTAARNAGAATPLGTEAEQLYSLYAGQVGGGGDFSGIINFLRGRQEAIA